MEEHSTGNHLRAIVVGSLENSFVRYLMDLLGSYEVDFVLCSDVYWAVAELAKNRRKNVLIIGRYKQLNRQSGRFFEMAPEYQSVCCCFAELPLANEQMSVLASTGAVVVNETDGIEKVVSKLLAEDKGQFDTKKKNGSSFNKNEFLTTQAERDALLGEQ